jgi:hypothetical protein
LQNFGREPQAKLLFRIPRGGWEDNIKMKLRERLGRFALDTCGSRQGQVAGSCEHGNEPSVSIKRREFLD